MFFFDVIFWYKSIKSSSNTKHYNKSISFTAQFSEPLILGPPSDPPGFHIYRHFINKPYTSLCTFSMSNLLFFFEEIFWYKSVKSSKNINHYNWPFDCSIFSSTFSWSTKWPTYIMTLQGLYVFQPKIGYAFCKQSYLVIKQSKKAHGHIFSGHYNTDIYILTLSK